MSIVEIVTGVLVASTGTAMVAMAWIGVLGVLGVVRVKRCESCRRLMVRAEPGHEVATSSASCRHCDHDHVPHLLHTMVRFHPQHH